MKEKIKKRYFIEFRTSTKVTSIKKVHLRVRKHADWQVATCFIAFIPFSISYCLFVEKNQFSNRNALNAVFKISAYSMEFCLFFKIVPLCISLDLCICNDFFNFAGYQYIFKHDCNDI